MASYAAVSTGTGKINKPIVKMAVPVQMPTAVATVKETVTATEPDSITSTGEETVKKKNRRKKLSKTERQRRKEDETFKKIYGPKDSHIQLISSAVLKKLNDYANKPNKSNHDGYVYSVDEFPAFTRAAPSEETLKPKVGGILEEDFPSLVPDVKPDNLNVLLRGLKTKPRIPNVEMGTSEFKLDVAYTKSETDSHVPKPTCEDQPCAKDEESGWETENDNPVDDEDVRHSITKEGLSKKQVTEVSSSSEPVASSSKKKSKNPFVVSLDALIKVNKSDSATKRREAKKSKVVKKDAALLSEKKTLGNTLDASGPVLIKRGKMREKPKKKKMSALKKAILLSRALRASKYVNGQIEIESSGTTPEVLNSPPTAVKVEVADTPVVKVEISDTHVVKEFLHSPAESGNSLATVESDNMRKYSKGQESKKLPSLVQVQANKLEQQPKLSCEKILTKVDIVTHIRQQNIAVSKDNLFAALLDNAIQSQQSPEQESVVKQEPEATTEELEPDIIMKAKKSMHSRKFRPYCNMYVSKELHGHLIALMKELHRFQDRLYHTDPIKFQSKRRYVHGLKDTNNYLDINKVCLVILAPDVEANDVKGGLDDKISTIISKAAAKNVPVVFSGNRFILGKLIMIKSQVSAIAVLDKQGAEDLFRTVICESANLREKYEKDLNDRVKQVMSENISDGGENLQ